MKRLAVSIFALALASCAMSPEAAITGRWRSAAPEPLPPSASGDVNYLVRSFQFEGDRWSIDFTVFADAATQSPLLSGRNSGRFVLASNPNDQEALAEFFFEQRSLTAHAQPIADALNAAGCGDGAWIVGAAQDVARAGCRAFRIFPRAECDREYDRVLRDGDRLFLGARPADGNLCTADRRPARIGAAPLVPRLE